MQIPRLDYLKYLTDYTLIHHWSTGLCYLKRKGHLYYGVLMDGSEIQLSGKKHYTVVATADEILNSILSLSFGIPSEESFLELAQELARKDVLGEEAYSEYLSQTADYS